MQTNTIISVSALYQQLLKRDDMKVTQGTSTSGPSGSRESRVATHSHIKGLGLGEDGLPLPGTAQGFTGQRAAREVGYDAA